METPPPKILAERPDRAWAITRVPSAGENVTLRRATRSARGDAGRSVRLRTISAIATRISISANAAPMHRRTPPPNGIQAAVAGAPSRKRSGRKANGSG